MRDSKESNRVERIISCLQPTTVALLYALIAGSKGTDDTDAQGKLELCIDIVFIILSVISLISIKFSSEQSESLDMNNPEDYIASKCIIPGKILKSIEFVLPLGAGVSSLAKLKQLQSPLYSLGFAGVTLASMSQHLSRKKLLAAITHLVQVLGPVVLFIEVSGSPAVICLAFASGAALVEASINYRMFDSKGNGSRSSFRHQAYRYDPEKIQELLASSSSSFNTLP